MILRRHYLQDLSWRLVLLGFFPRDDSYYEMHWSDLQEEASR